MAHNWPEIPYGPWKTTHEALHQWLQVVGKFRLAHTSWVNHSWHATFYVNARGLTSGLIHTPERAVQADFDFIDHQLVLSTSDGQSRRLSLGEMSVAEFFTRFDALAHELGVGVEIHGAPNEVPGGIPFAENTATVPYDRDATHRFWVALLQVDRVLRQFRTAFLGKVSPVHVFWGSFDMAVTRFSGRTAPPHPGGVPKLPDKVTREAYSHEVSSAGFWGGGGGVDEPSFYSYAYPTPKHFSEQKVEPAEASFQEALGEFVLPYDVVRRASDPDRTLLAFLESTYAAAARLGDWPRSELECAPGQPLVPRAA